MRKPQLTIRDMAVHHRQIFDYRGTRDKLLKWRQLSLQDDVWTVTFRQENYERLTVVSKELGREVNIVHFAEETGVFADREMGRTVVLFDLPRRKATLMSMADRLGQAERIYCLFGDPDLGFDRLSFPGRDQFKMLYQVFTRYPQVQKIHLDALARKIQVKRDVLDGMLAVFEELGFVYGDDECYRLHSEPGKRSLEHSRIYTEWKEEAELATELLLSSHEELLRYFDKRAETTAL
jgi:single-stranded-DNA-specific exonuclease